MQPLEKNRSSHNRLERIMLIDDDPLFLRLYRQLLATHHQSYELVECSDGYAALARMLERTPRLILLDLTMPRFDGTRFLAIVKSKPELKSLPIFVISTDAEEAHRSMGELDGVRWFSKPIRIRTLQQMIDNELSKTREGGDALRTPGSAASPLEFDAAHLATYVGRNRAAQLTIAHQFCCLAAERLALLERLTMPVDRTGLHELAHVLEGSASVLGAPRLLSECKRLRHALDAESADEGIRHSVSDLTTSLRCFTVSLARHFDLTDF